MSKRPVERVDLRRRRDHAAGDAEQGARMHGIDMALIGMLDVVEIQVTATGSNKPLKTWIANGIFVM
jgi:hypothetical protein